MRSIPPKLEEIKRKILGMAICLSCRDSNISHLLNFNWFTSWEAKLSVIPGYSANQPLFIYIIKYPKISRAINKNISICSGCIELF